MNPIAIQKNFRGECARRSPKKNFGDSPGGICVMRHASCVMRHASCVMRHAQMYTFPPCRGVILVATIIVATKFVPRYFRRPSGGPPAPNAPQCATLSRTCQDRRRRQSEIRAGGRSPNPNGPRKRISGGRRGGSKTSRNRPFYACRRANGSTSGDSGGAGGGSTDGSRCRDDGIPAIRGST